MIVHQSELGMQKSFALDVSILFVSFLPWHPYNHLFMFLKICFLMLVFYLCIWITCILFWLYIFSIDFFNVQDLVLCPFPSGFEIMCSFIMNSENRLCRVEVQCCNCTLTDSCQDPFITDLNPEKEVKNVTTCDLECSPAVFCFSAFDTPDSTLTPAVEKSDVMVPQPQTCSGTYMYIYDIGVEIKLCFS